MSENSEGSFVRFNELIQALSNKTVIRTKNGQINISGTILSGKDFDSLYLADIKDLLAKYEETISPEFAPTKQLYSTLDILSSPVLKSTKVPETISAFYKKMSQAMQEPSNEKIFEETLTEYVTEASDAPVFMLASMNSELPSKDESSIYKSLMPSSSTIMDGYGIKYNGDDILYLANEGFVEPQHPMDMLIYKSLPAQDETSLSYVEPVSYEALLEFYSAEKNPNMMRNLLQSGKITPAFSEHHQEMLDNVTTAQKKAYIKDLIADVQDNAHSSEEFSNEVLAFSNAKIIPDASLENNISGEFLRQKYLAKEITISRVFDIYKTAPKYFSAVESILTPSEITSAHENDELGDDSLMYIPEHSRVAYLHKNNTKFTTMMYLFLHCDGFSITELKQLLSESRIAGSLDSYIDTGSNPARIKELYENYLIDYQCIKTLKNSGILSEKDIKKYNFSISKEAVYQEIANNPNVQIVGSANIVPSATTGFFLGKTVKTTSPEALNNTYKVLGAPEDISNLPTISHVDERKKTSFLDKYRIIPLKDTNLVALVPPSNSSSTYLMPYQEVTFILYNNRLPANFSENESIKEIEKTERLEEDILKTAYQFEEAKPYLTRLGYSEELDFDKNMETMLEQYIKIKIKGEN